MGFDRTHGVRESTFPEFRRYFEEGCPPTTICICGHPEFSHDPQLGICKVHADGCRCPNFNRTITVDNAELFFVQGIGPGPGHALYLSTIHYMLRNKSRPTLSTFIGPWNMTCYRGCGTKEVLDPCVLSKYRKLIVNSPSKGSVTKWICRDCSGLSNTLKPLQQLLLSA